MVLGVKKYNKYKNENTLCVTKVMVDIGIGFWLNRYIGTIKYNVFIRKET